MTKSIEQPQNKMGTSPLLPLVASMALPATFSMLIQALYNIVDSMYVAQIGEQALTAVSLALPLQSLVFAVSVGTGIGINSFISRSLGAKLNQDANNAADHGFFLGICSGIIFALIGFFFSKPFISAFTSDPQIIAMGSSYLSIVLIFSTFCFIQINSEKTLQATGNMIWPMIFQLLGAITNIILDPIFIFGYFGVPKMGVTGAAIATVLGQFLAMSFSIFILTYKKHTVEIDIKNFSINSNIISSIYKVGFPSIIMQSIATVMIIGLNTILIKFSSTAVAVIGIYFKLQMFVFMPIFGIMQGIMPIIGYNFGAKNKERLMGAMKIGLYGTLIIMLLGTLIFNLAPNILLLMFNPTEQMIEYGVPALRIISLGFSMAGASIIISTAFQAIGNGSTSLYISILRQLGIILPVAYLLSKTSLGVKGVWWSFFISEIVTLIISLLTFYKTYTDKIATL
ncbi:MAG: MATE family efflux transporter [Filifactoraceae bacterium]